MTSFILKSGPILFNILILIIINNIVIMKMVLDKASRIFETMGTTK